MGKRILVSSAKIMKWEEGDEIGRSLMYKRNKSGPRIDPCGTRHTISLCVDPGGYSTLNWVRMCGPKFRPPPYN